ncbi:tRNA lysidine(34) synthetase TilS [Mesorhizobium sp. M7A.F.Ca.CA.001.09.2.1]|uniref:tRNA(Ile)-lysidine synthase n=2 Tax=Mesorhizobium TaxID=68287 RepID=A0AB38TFY2_9HYPH|nr:MULTISPECIES: tRNA lysidine(34) synthetase TilS [Mesorhizobium]MDF3214592.1 tRNA lysidine(34) synthetase TilS [Mesorhizobium ciceri]RUY60153.1 tRNA lysidine(34) synthetase TilS [Mesorhizobium sp. M7A.F.Ca.CA.001.05.1.1]RUY71885.1 tRNA lysidine(34) synthetase TilS [Mesorhizobium sp. M7A.F.Ca.CA.001.13.1.1]RUY79902.1 tRNA lysidine(34) synthetase TilS [Mesorhizobium sp. M7A.F.Ca.CA.001.09.2.1]RUZ05643.1 tRNA lysidine(34) synthetase TilS [Mesorhizobium sp. M7A.F.Ca.CA.001.04.2.1]
MLDTEPDLSTNPFSRIDFTSGAVAAVSGGSDSTALLLLLKHHLERRAPATRLLAVTIDHGLRSGSAAEAQTVAKLCARIGISHRILTWSGPKPSTGLPAAAREARYRLLAEAAQAEGIGMILTGHTADDQAETVLMRHARDAGQGHAGMAGRGLAGMAPATLYDWRIWIVRPLLGVRRAVLRDVLRRQNVGWADDPTNVDAAFERPRVRAALAGESVEHVKGMLMLAGQAALERRQLGASAADLIDGFASQPAIGLIRLDPCLLSSGDEQAAVYALRILLATTGGIAFLPDQARSEALFGRLRAGFLCATLSRTVVDSRRSGIFLRREARGLPAAAAATGSTLWDGRRHITLNDSSSALLIAPLGAAAAKRLATGEGKTPSSLMRAALAAEPAVWQAGECLGLPGYGLKSATVEARPVVAPFGRFLPSFDLAPARAVAGLIGAAPVPPLPFSGHSAG